MLQELRRQASWHGRSRSRFFHFRDRDDFEVDIVLEQGHAAVAGVEVKAAATVSAADLRGLRKLREAAGKQLRRGRRPLRRNRDHQLRRRPVRRARAQAVGDDMTRRLHRIRRRRRRPRLARRQSVHGVGGAAHAAAGRGAVRERPAVGDLGRSPRSRFLAIETAAFNRPDQSIETAGPLTTFPKWVHLFPLWERPRGTRVSPAPC